MVHINKNYSDMIFRCRLRFFQRLLCLVIALSGLLLLILYRYYELEALKSNEWLMKQLGIEEVVENKFDNNAPVKETLDSPKVMYKKKTSHNNVVTSKGLSVDAAWQVWRSWPHTKQLYEEQYFSSNQMADILHHMATAPIINYDVGHRGTQLKALATLQGDQLAVFKPKRYVH